MSGSRVYGIDAKKESVESTWRERAARFGGRARDWAVDVATDRRVIAVATTVVVLLLMGFTYCWIAASRMIDARLAGGAVDARSGIFAAPLVVRPGQPLAREDLVSYLQQLGYSSDSEKTSGIAGRFAVDGDSVTVEPLDASVLAAGRYTPVRIEFSGERGIQKVVDTRTDKQVKEAWVEPLAISASYAAKEKRIPVTYDGVPEVLRGAILSTEDRRFWAHNGVDYRGLARAARENFGEDEIRQGGSTITQQVVKNVFLSPERSYTRKAKEAFISYVLESKLSKQEIFALYCNEVYLGQSGTYAVHGIAEAAQQFFGKDLAALSLDESALLAGLINSPNANSPYRHPERAQARRDLVLDMMVETGAATREAADAAKAKPIALAPVTRDSAWLDAPYFDDYVRDYVEASTSGVDATSNRFKVETTIDINLQRAAAAAVDTQLAKLDAVLAKGKNGVAPGTVQASLVAIDPKTGAVLAMVGGRDYASSQLNRATDAMRQPGSVFKPFVYATALTSRRFTPASPVLDAPQKFTYGRDVYEPGNFGDSYANKEIPLRMALRYSKNVATVAIALQTGLSNIAATAERAGLPKPDTYPAMALGTYEATPLQIAEAYSAFANGGRGVEPTPVASSESNGVARSGRVMTRQVLSPQVAYVMTDMLEDVVARGTGAGVRARGVKGAVAGKTGTSRDGWFAGYTPNMVVVVWVGFDDGRQLGMTGADSALPIWADFVKQAVAFRPELGGDAFPKPSGISTARVCDESGLLAGDLCPSSHDEIFVSGTEPSAECMTHAAQYAEGMIPMYDEQGNFVGYEPAPELPPDVAEAPSDATVGETTVDDDDRIEEAKPQPIPGMVTLPPAEDGKETKKKKHDEDEEDEDEENRR